MINISNVGDAENAVEQNAAEKKEQNSTLDTLLRGHHHVMSTGKSTREYFAAPWKM